MKKIVFLILSVSFIGCYSAKKINHVKFDKKAESKILYGYTSLDGFKLPLCADWYNFEYEGYSPDSEIIDLLSGANIVLPDKIIIVMGSWCSDSRREVPRFIKILETLKFPEKNLVIINVDTKKQAEKTEVGLLDIKKVPTFIFYKSSDEIGRVIESPAETLEKDFYRILSAK
ncbi:MAG: thioredoxin family protein [Bacteroidales bacterium]